VQGGESRPLTEVWEKKGQRHDALEENEGVNSTEVIGHIKGKEIPQVRKKKDAVSALLTAKEEGKDMCCQKTARKRHYWVKVSHPNQRMKERVMTENEGGTKSRLTIN